MTKAILEQIERQLSEMDAEAMSFDHEEAEQCKAALVRIVDQAVTVCQRLVAAKPPRSDQGPKGWQIDHASHFQQQRESMSRPLHIPEFVGGGVTVTKVEATFVRVKEDEQIKPRRSISVGKGNADE